MAMALWLFHGYSLAVVIRAPGAFHSENLRKLQHVTLHHSCAPGRVSLSPSRGQRSKATSSSPLSLWLRYLEQRPSALWIESRFLNGQAVLVAQPSCRDKTRHANVRKRIVQPLLRKGGLGGWWWWCTFPPRTNARQM